MDTGIHDISMQEYIDLRALSSGVCHKLLTASPMHAWNDSPWNPARVDAASDASDLGTCAHAVLLEGSNAKICVINPEEYRSKPTKDNPDGGIPKGWTNNAIKEARDMARANGLIPLLPWDMLEVNAMVDSARKYLAGSALANVFESGRAESTIVWQEGDVLCKARPDWMNSDTMLHLKTTAASVNPRAFTRMVANMGYDLSLMFYMRGLAAVMPDADVDHVILAIEQAPPYACKLFDLTRARADVAERQVERAIGVWARCQAAGKWPMYDGTVHSIDLTPWELAQAEEDMLTDGELAAGIPA